MKSIHCAGTETSIYESLDLWAFFSFLMCLNYLQGCKDQSRRNHVAVRKEN